MNKNSFSSGRRPREAKQAGYSLGFASSKIFVSVQEFTHVAIKPLGGNGEENFLFIYSDLWEWNGADWKQIDKGQTYKFDMNKNKFVNVEE